MSSQQKRIFWKKQAIVLAVEDVSTPYQQPFRRRRPRLQRWVQHNAQSMHIDIMLTPRLLPIQSTCNPLKLLFLLMKYCSFQLQPCSAFFHISMISRPILHNMHANKLAFNNGLSFPSFSMTCTTIMDHFLKRVIILRIQCDTYANIDLMIDMVEAAMAEEKECQLKHLICTLPDIYRNIVQQFSDLLLLSNFHQLCLELNEVNILTLSKLLLGFMTAPCSHKQQLSIYTKGETRIPTTIERGHLAALDMGGAVVPQCALQHKMLKFSPQSQFTQSLHILLKLPTIRLNEIVILNHHQHLHLCADLQVMKLVIRLDKIFNQASVCPGRFHISSQDAYPLGSLSQWPMGSSQASKTWSDARFV